ncbi:FMN-binding negative transcriptional regulator [Cohnella thailandensis]|uniref:FMN-binding negative transcriptional regulator n=1 Tax=Cohnella thailandensis TaxID=557557 RepID=A0A841T0D8_9BACL|nr:FMN-binding negative transcriptional regulator [Cohnella thailandensis]MBB6637893.1 FMN-binding negative transcriptional regulator [Cohnella thailandensis]MBP1977399.1 transcriptional regulator [Cohnella thailandensis]
MYIPKEYEMKDEETLVDFIREYSFGILFSQAKGAPHGTHLPFLIERDKEGQLYLVSHMSRANPQWQAIGGTVLTVFPGPHAYVTPSWYGAAGFVPTWDYLSVHAYGDFARVDDAEGLRSIMERTIRFYESGMPEPWDGRVPDHVYDRLIGGVVGFRIKIARLEGQWKLHQDHTEERRRNVIRHLRQSGREDARSIADAIERAMPASRPAE